MLIIQHQITNKIQRIAESEIDDLCLILASDVPLKPTDKERRRAEVYKDRIMKQGRTIKAAGVLAWRAQNIPDEVKKEHLRAQAEEVFNAPR